MTHRQFKLTSGEEIICEVIEEPEEDDVNLVIRYPMLIITGFSQQGDVRYYSFKPWMTFQLKEGYMQLLNYTHIVGEAKPSALVVEQYKKNLEMEIGKPKEQSLSDAYDDVINKMKELLVADSDDQESNVIQFGSRFDKDKLH